MTNSTHRRRAIHQFGRAGHRGRHARRHVAVGLVDDGADVRPVIVKLVREVNRMTVMSSRVGGKHQQQALGQNGQDGLHVRRHAVRARGRGNGRARV